MIAIFLFVFKFKPNDSLLDHNIHQADRILTYVHIFILRYLQGSAQILYGHDISLQISGYILVAFTRSEYFVLHQNRIYDTVNQRFFNHNPILLGISFCCGFVAAHHIAINFCKCHSSIAVVSYATFCSDQFVKISMRTRRHIHHIRIVVKISLLILIPVADHLPCCWQRHETKGISYLKKTLQYVAPLSHTSYKALGRWLSHT